MSDHRGALGRGCHNDRLVSDLNYDDCRNLHTRDCISVKLSAVQLLYAIKARWCEEKWMNHFLVISVTFYKYNHYFKIN